MRRLGLWLLFLLPLGYVGMILTVTAHEVLGHGGFAVLAGGTLRGFNVQHDGMGSAYVYAAGHRTWMLSGGIVVQVVLGSLWVGVALLVRRRPLIHAALVLLAMNFFLDGLPYGFWDAVFEGDIGDVGRILSGEAWPPLRPILLSVLGLLLVGTTALTSWLLFRVVERDAGPLSLAQAMTVAGALLVGMVVGFASFDWEQLIPGAGLVPAIGAGLLQSVIGVWLVLTRRRQVERVRVSKLGWGIGIPAAWFAAGAVVTVVALWLSEGIYWD